jgi:hypothetical protein
MEEGHLPVMPDEVLGTLSPRPGSLQIDATVGGGGHTERILEAASPDGRVLGLDADQAAIEQRAVDGTEARLRCDRRQVPEVPLPQDQSLAEASPKPDLDAMDRRRVGVDAEDPAFGTGGLQDPLGVPTGAQGGIDVKAAGRRREHLDDLVRQHRQVPFLHLSSIPDADPERTLEAHMVWS